MKHLFYLIVPFFLLTSCDKFDSWLGIDEEDDPTEKPEKPVEPQPEIDPSIHNGLAVYYQFEGNFDDSSENGIHGFGSNNPEFVEGLTPGTKAMKLNRMRNTQFSIPEALIDRKEASVSFWGKNFDDGNIFYIPNNGNRFDYGLSMTGGKLRFRISRDTPAFEHPVITDGLWHHIVITIEEPSVKLFVDGQLVDIYVCSYMSDYFFKGLKFIVGGHNPFLEMDGNNMIIDNLRIYDTHALSNDRVYELYESKL